MAILDSGFVHCLDKISQKLNTTYQSWKNKEKNSPGLILVQFEDFQSALVDHLITGHYEVINKTSQVINELKNFNTDIPNIILYTVV